MSLIAREPVLQSDIAVNRYNVRASCLIFITELNVLPRRNIINICCVKYILYSSLGIEFIDVHTYIYLNISILLVHRLAFYHVITGFLASGRSYHLKKKTEVVSTSTFRKTDRLQKST